jgi:hypothetical protein
MEFQEKLKRIQSEAGKFVILLFKNIAGSGKMVQSDLKIRKK